MKKENFFFGKAFFFENSKKKIFSEILFFRNLISYFLKEERDKTLQNFKKSKIIL